MLFCLAFLVWTHYSYARHYIMYTCTALVLVVFLHSTESISSPLSLSLLEHPDMHVAIAFVHVAFVLFASRSVAAFVPKISPLARQSTSSSSSRLHSATGDTRYFSNFDEERAWRHAEMRSLAELIHEVKRQFRRAFHPNEVRMRRLGIIIIKNLVFACCADRLRLLCVYSSRHTRLRTVPRRRLRLRKMACERQRES